MLWMFYVATSEGIIPLATACHIWALNYIIQQRKAGYIPQNAERNGADMGWRGFAVYAFDPPMM